MLDKIKVDYYGTPTPLQQVGNISVPEARIIQIQPWEKKLIREIEKAIMTSDLGINPTNDGSMHPPGIPGTDRGARKKSCSRMSRKKARQAKVAVRNIRRDGNEAFKKFKGGEMFRGRIKDLEAQTFRSLTDKFIKEVDKAVESEIQRRL